MNKSTILKEYNIVKQLTANELAVYAKTYKDNNDTIVILMVKKPNKPDQPPKWFSTWNKDVFSKVLDEIKDIKTRLTKIETRLDKHDELLKTHGWVK